MVKHGGYPSRLGIDPISFRFCYMQSCNGGSWFVGRLVGSSNPSQPVDGHEYYSGINSAVYDKPSYIPVNDKLFVFVITSTGESPV